jgi:hypothetical protein
VPAATLAASPRPARVRNSLRDTSWPAWRSTVFSRSLVTDIEANKERGKAVRLGFISERRGAYSCILIKSSFGWVICGKWLFLKLINN